MPKKEVDYSNTIIYKLCCNDINIHDIYIGHTTNFNQRKNNHRICCENLSCTRYVYEFIRYHGDWDNWSMIQIEEINCNNKREAEAREHYWIQTLNASLNTNKPYAMFKETPKEYKQEWYNKNKEEILEKSKKRYEENSEEKRTEGG